MILSDKTIREEIKKGRLVIEPFEKEAVQPSSVDLRLGYEFRIFNSAMLPFIDPRNHIKDYTDVIKLKKNKFIVIHPGQFILGTTLERFKIPSNLVARLEGRSSLGRLGIMIHSTAGYVDPGFKGILVLEISNVGSLPLALYPEMPICQISFAYLTTPAENPYGSRKVRSKYQGQRTATPSKLEKEFKK